MKAILAGKVQEPARPKTPAEIIEMAAPEPVAVEGLTGGDMLGETTKPPSTPVDEQIAALAERVKNLEELAVKHHSWWDVMRTRFLGGVLPE